VDVEDVVVLDNDIAANVFIFVAVDVAAGKSEENFIVRTDRTLHLKTCNNEGI
jgi:hypothetical protein